MRTLLALAVVVLSLILADVMVVTWTNNRLTIQVDTGKIKEEAQKAIGETGRFLRDPEKSFRGEQPAGVWDQRSNKRFWR
jgi:hypothetical protein